MAERNIKLKFMGTPYLVLIDSRSFTLRKENKPNDKFPTPLGYHRSVFTLCECLMRQGFHEVKQDYTVKTFVKQVWRMWTEDIKPFLEVCRDEQNALSREILVQLRTNEDLGKLVELVHAGKTAQAKTLADKIKQG